MDVAKFVAVVIGGISLFLTVAYRILCVLEKAIRIRILLHKSKRKKDATPYHE